MKFPILVCYTYKTINDDAVVEVRHDHEIVNVNKFTPEMVKNLVDAITKRYEIAYLEISDKQFLGSVKITSLVKLDRD